jgi:RimJ/RimL family protein N-acetyltransferase
VIIKLPQNEDLNLPASPIGFMKLVPPGKRLEHHHRANFSISLVPTAHGQGYGTEALRWLLEIGFKRANLHRIKGSYYANNTTAANCYRKL